MIQFEVTILLYVARFCSELMADAAVNNVYKQDIFGGESTAG